MRRTSRAAPCASPPARRSRTHLHEPGARVGVELLERQEHGEGVGRRGGGLPRSRAPPPTARVARWRSSHVSARFSERAKKRSTRSESVDARFLGLTSSPPWGPLEDPDLCGTTGGFVVNGEVPVTNPAALEVPPIRNRTAFSAQWGPSAPRARTRGESTRWPGSATSFGTRVDAVGVPEPPTA